MLSGGATAYIVAAGPVDSLQYYKTLPAADIVIAADGGYDNAVAVGWQPNVIIGDMDSIRANDAIRDANQQTQILRYHPEKDKTDLHLAVDYAMQNGYRNIVLLFAFGGRIDHSIAAVITLRYIMESGGSGVMLCENSKVELIAECTTREIKKDEYTKVSLIPMTTTVCGVTTSGLKYPLSGAVLRQTQNLGVSNEFTSDTAIVSISQGLLLAIYEKD